MAAKSKAGSLERHPRPSVAVDVVALTVEAGQLRVALYKRAEPPQRGHFALPGGFMHIDESIDDAANRVMAAKVGLAGSFLEQLYTFGDLRRDPRGRVITVAYYALVDARRFRAKATPAARSARVLVPWPGETGGPVDVVGDDGRALPLFLDHADLLGLAVKQLRGKLDDSPVGFQLLPTEFTLRQLQEIHEAVRGEPLNKDSFRRRMLASGLLEATGAHEREVVHRPAELYRFTRRSAL
ncbi:MAG: Nudix-related transcriptional regulator NrtR [Myxococcales bacterium]|nr:Nudix-related transcriptional regulator NrtR [Myxococcales bacterium]